MFLEVKEFLRNRYIPPLLALGKVDPYAVDPWDGPRPGVEFVPETCASNASE
jgi:hypothetical protein